MRRTGITGVVLLSSAALAGAARADVTGYEDLITWGDLPTLRTGVIAGLASSYDRRGTDATADTNTDHNNYEGWADGYYIAANLTGPGVVTRVWEPHLTANAAGTLRFVVDGVPVIATDTDAFLGGSYGTGPLFRGPMVSTRAGGQVSYEPIVFQNSLRVEMTIPPTAAFYQVNYKLYPAGTVVPSHAAAPSGPQLADRARAVQIMEGAGANPAVADPLAQVVAQGAAPLAAGGTRTLANLAGSGQVRALRLKLQDGSLAPTDAQLDGLRLRVRYDGAAEYAVDVPVSSFFGVGHGRAAYKSIPLGVADDGAYYCYWPMPFRAGAVVELYNAGGGAVPVLATEVEVAAGPVAADAAYFHAVNHQETTVAGQVFHTMLQVEGSGHYVGNFLSDRNGYLLEGDDVIVADGTRVLHGTGLEDAYNGGYGYNWAWDGISDDGDVPMPTAATGPFAGLLKGNAQIWTDQYRWLINDMVPFSQGIDVKIENYQRQAGSEFDSTAFYYLAPVPEPGVAGMMAGAVALGAARRRRRVTWGRARG